MGRELSIREPLRLTFLLRSLQISKTRLYQSNLLRKTRIVTGSEAMAMDGASASQFADSFGKSPGKCLEDFRP